VWWVEQGYAVVICDLRGAGTSDGVGALLSDQEGEDIYDLVEWAAAQAWSTGAVRMLGVSYLAVSQWKAAALRPPSLRAIVPWEGFTDGYRGLVRPGGFPEVGFLRIWNAGMRHAREAYSLLAESKRRPQLDAWWRSLVPDLTEIEIPVLICGSFSDNTSTAVARSTGSNGSGRRNATSTRTERASGRRSTRTRPRTAQLHAPWGTRPRRPSRRPRHPWATVLEARVEHRGWG
jgi:hypothetical protein